MASRPRVRMRNYGLLHAQTSKTVCKLKECVQLKNGSSSNQINLYKIYIKPVFVIMKLH
jgi:hypothetical protein